VNELWTIYGLVFGAAILAVEALYWLVFRARGVQKAVNRRLALSAADASPTEVFEALRHERGFADFSAVGFADFSDFLVQTGLRLSMWRLAAWTAALMVCLWGAASLLVSQMWISIPLAVALAPTLVALYLRIARSRRIAAFAEQLPDAVDIIVRGLRVGHPFTSAVELVAREMHDPIGSEFGMTADEMSFGQDVASAVSHLYRRVGQDDLMFLVIAITVQSQSGGNLAEVLARLSRLVRERSKLRLKVRSLSAEGRLSAWMLSAMPFVLAFAIQFVSPNFFSELWTSTALVPALAYVAASLGISNFVIYRMVNFKV
jgi:tight adherence protein B